MTTDNSTSFYKLNDWGELVEAPEDPPDLSHRYHLQANVLGLEDEHGWESLGSYATARDALLGCSVCVETFRAMIGGDYLGGDADIEQVVSVRIWDSKSRRVILWEDEERRVRADGRVPLRDRPSGRLLICPNQKKPPDPPAYAQDDSRSDDPAIPTQPSSETRSTLREPLGIIDHPQRLALSAAAQTGRAAAEHTARIRDSQIF